jgi:hypothetical protein
MPKAKTVMRKTPRQKWELMEGLGVITAKFPTAEFTMAGGILKYINVGKCYGWLQTMRL